MPKISSWLPRSFAASLAVVSVLASSTPGAWAQQSPTPTRIRGTIESVDGKTMSIKTREGTDVKVNMTDDIGVIGIAKTTLSEIKKDSYIGVSGMPQPDGSQKAIAIHIFPEAMRGANEGFRPWDLRPNSTMTNATVAQTVAGVDGQVIDVKYKDGEKKVVVTPDTAIVAFVNGEKSDIKPGAKVIIFGAKKLDDGSLETNRIGVGKDGIAPPM
jgi:hypothetical protein